MSLVNQQPKITVIINGKNYRLSADDPEAINRLPEAERSELLHLLESIKQQQARSQQTQKRVLSAIAEKSPEASATALPPRSAQEQASLGLKQTDRLGRGDADAVMARLIQEEARNRKPGLSKQGIYKFVGISALVVFLLVLIF